MGGENATTQNARSVADYYVTFCVLEVATATHKSNFTLFSSLNLGTGDSQVVVLESHNFWDLQDSVPPELLSKYQKDTTGNRTPSNKKGVFIAFC